MSPALRFFAGTLVLWAGVRAASLGALPGTATLAYDTPLTPPAAILPPVVETDFAPPQAATYTPDMSPDAAMIPASYSADPYPYGFAPSAPPQWRAAPGVSRPRQGERLDLAPIDYSLAYNQPAPPLDQWPVAGLARQRPRSAAQALAQAIPKKVLDRLQLSAWATYRGADSPADARGLASGGLLGGSQAGARLTYALDRHFAVSARTSAPIGTTVGGGEAALGLRYAPIAGFPFAVTAERRRAFGKFGGRSAFALFAEGGVYDRPIAAGFLLDAYAQAGVVGLRSRDLFADGAMTLSRPLWRNLSGGFGVWGGVQPGLYRVDAGPRLTMRLGRGMKIHADYRQRLAGTARPASGPALTLAGDF